MALCRTKRAAATWGLLFVFGVFFLQNYSTEYEYTIRPTIRTEQNTNTIFSTALICKKDHREQQDRRSLTHRLFILSFQ